MKIISTVLFYIQYHNNEAINNVKNFHSHNVLSIMRIENLDPLLPLAK